MLSFPYTQFVQVVMVNVALAFSVCAADGPFLLPPGASAGSETSAGAIPLAVVDQVRPHETLDPTAAKSVTAAFSATLKGGGSFQLKMTGFPLLVHNQAMDANGVISSANFLHTAGDAPRFLEPMLSTPAIWIKTGTPADQMVGMCRIRAVAVAASDSQAQALMVFDVLPSQNFNFNQAIDTRTAKPTSRLIMRLFHAKDGWSRVQLQLDAGMSFAQLPIQHVGDGQGRTEKLWFMGKVTDYSAQDIGHCAHLPLDPAVPGAMWYGVGKKGAGTTGQIVFAPSFAPVIGAGNFYERGPCAALKVVTTGPAVRFMYREVPALGSPEKDMGDFPKKLPSLAKDLEATDFSLPPTAEGLALGAHERTFIDRMLVDAPNLPDGKAAAARVATALKAFDAATAAFSAAAKKPIATRLALEETLALARSQLAAEADPLMQAWTAAGGVAAKLAALSSAKQTVKPTSKSPAKTVSKPAEQLAVQVIPEDERYRLDAPAVGPETTRWFGPKPVGGKLSVLVLYGVPDYFEHHGRKLAELKRALDLDLEYAVTFECSAVPSRVDVERVRALLASRRWDVIVPWNIQPWYGRSDIISLLPSDLRTQIFRSVIDQGTGLLLLADKSIPEFCRPDRLQPAEGATIFAGLNLVGRQGRLWRVLDKDNPAAIEQQFGNTYFQTFQAGAGIALAVDMGENTAMATSRTPGRIFKSEMVPWSLGNRVDGDYFHAEMARLLWRAAGRQPGVTFLKSPPSLAVAPGTAASHSVAWRIRATPDVTDVKASFRLRNVDGTVISQSTRSVALNSAEADISFALPELPSGLWYLDLFLDSARGRENFAYASIFVRESCTVALQLDPVAAPLPGWRAPDGTEYTTLAIQPGEPIRGHVSVTPTADQVPVTLRLRLIDDGDRILATQALSITPGAAQPVSFATTGIERIPLRVVAQALTADGRVVGGVQREFCLNLTRRDRFQVSLAGAVTDPWWMWTLRGLERQGVSMISTGETGSRANLGASMFSGVANLRGKFRGNDVGDGWDIGKQTLYLMAWDESSGKRSLHPVPWNEPKDFEDVLDMTSQIWDQTRQFPVPELVLNDEGSNLCADTSDAGMRAWQDWLKVEYRNDISALNREWETTFKAFTDIDGTTGRHNKELRGDPFEGQAMADGKIARWADRHVFANTNFANLVCDGFTRRARQGDPGARVGLSGTFAFHNFCTDYDSWLQKSSSWSVYSTPRGGDSLAMDLIRSNRPAGYRYGYWVGYDNSSQLPLIWDMVFRGATTVWWFQLSGDGPNGWLGRNDQPYPARQRAIDQAILPLRRGLGDLLLRLPQRSDPIALYYSPHLALVSGTTFPPEMKGPGIGNDYVTAASSGAGASDLVRDSGRQFHYLTKGRVLAGDLQKLGITVLLLPMAQPLGEDEVAAFRTFAERGGVVIADLRPGVLSGRGRAQASGPADALFGIKRTGAGKPKGLTISGKLNGESIDLGGVLADPDLGLAGAKAGALIDGVPVLMRNPVGTGSVWLLNAGFDRYSSVRDGASGMAWRALFARMAGLPQPYATLANTTGSNPRARMQLWEQGGVRLYGVLEGDGSGKLTLPAAAHLFDLRRGPLGLTDKAPIDIFGADTAHFIAAYAYDPGRPVITVGKPTAGIVTCAISMSGVPSGEAGTFSYHTRLLDPTGTWIDVIPWSVQGVGGRAEVQIRFAENDPAGAWSLHAREVTTGRETAVTLVRP